MAKTTMIKAITQALDQEIKRDDKVLVFGEDVGRNGGFSGQLTACKMLMVKTGSLIPR